MPTIVETKSAGNKNSINKRIIKDKIMIEEIFIWFIASLAPIVLYIYFKK